MKINQIVVDIILAIVILLNLTACAPSTNYIVRFDINKDELNCLYNNMSKKEVFEALGQPHRSTEYINSSIYDYFIGDDLLRMEFKHNNLETAHYFGQDGADPIKLPDKGADEIDKNKYLKMIDYNLSSDDLEFISSDTNYKGIQSTLGPPHYITEYNLDGVILNAFAYGLKDGNRLIIVYKRNGLVGIVQIQNKDGETVKDIVKE